MEKRPRVAQCGFCEQGQLRPIRCRSCKAVLAVCDECELIWADLNAVHTDSQVKSAGAHPICPACEERQSSWELLTREELVALGLEELLL